MNRKTLADQLRLLVTVCIVVCVLIILIPLILIFLIVAIFFPGLRSMVKSRIFKIKTAHSSTATGTASENNVPLGEDIIDVVAEVVESERTVIDDEHSN